MRIAFDGRAFSSPAGGVRRYVCELCGALRRLDHSIELIALGAPRDAIIPSGVRRVAPALGAPTNLGWMLTGLPRTARTASFDLFHAPAYTAPLWGVRPVVLTIHDVSYARHPEWYPYRRGRGRRAFYRASAVRAARIITDSEFSRREIEAAYGISPENITVIPLAASAGFTVQPAQPRNRTVVHVGDLHARRNVNLLLDVVLDLRRDAAFGDLTLVIAGTDRGALDGLVRRASAAGVPDALRYVGCPDDVGLAELYGSAGVFAYPSRYEGFGLPLLEAMACGAPVVASSAAAIPEVVGSCIATLDPDDQRGWRDAIRALLTDEALACAATDASLARAATFTWERTAAATLSVYRTVRGQQS